MTCVLCCTAAAQLCLLPLGPASSEAYLLWQGASGGPELSLQLQWNNYEWCAETSSQENLLYYLFSQSPGSGGENTYKLAAMLLSSSFKLLFAAQSGGPLWLGLFLSFCALLRSFSLLGFCFGSRTGSIYRDPKASFSLQTSPDGYKQKYKQKNSLFLHLSYGQ